MKASNFPTRKAIIQLVDNGKTFPYLTFDDVGDIIPVYARLDLRDGKITVGPKERYRKTAEARKIVLKFKVDARATIQSMSEYLQSNYDIFQSILDISRCGRSTQGKQKGILRYKCYWERDVFSRVPPMPLSTYRVLANDHDLAEAYRVWGCMSESEFLVRLHEERTQKSALLETCYTAKRVSDVIRAYLASPEALEHYIG